MSLFQNLRQSIGGFFSPAPPKFQRPATRSPSLDEVKSRLDRDTVSPSKRTSEWLKTHSVEIKTPKALSIRGSRVTKPSPSKRQSAKAKANFWAGVLPNFLSKTANDASLDDLDGDTLLGEDRSSAWGGDDKDAAGRLSADIGLNPELANPALIAVDQEDTYYTPTAEDLDVMKTWSNDEVWLFHKLNMRGFEPLLPDTWDFEFVTLPDNIFSANDAKVLIKAREGSEYNGMCHTSSSPFRSPAAAATNPFPPPNTACRALQSLFNLGGRVRDRIACALRPEEALRRELLAYYKWSIMDAGLHRTDHIPVLAIGTSAPLEPVASVVGRVTDSLHDLGRQYRAHFFSHMDPRTRKPVFTRQLPTLYGAVITKMLVTFVTYDARFPGKPVQSMGHYDFSNGGQDVWHAMAVAIVMVRARDYLLRLKEEEQVGGPLEDGDTDVDA
ncbi:MAG: hypothetical protein LQ345_004519 [Seirophora villosa]|nr:MAG: hypothetical protein LQ345_004519 [Seirophora villosa]